MSRQKSAALLAIVVLLLSTFNGVFVAGAQTTGAASAPPTNLERIEQFWQGLYDTPNARQLQAVGAPLPMNGNLLAKAQPDECFAGIGDSGPHDLPCLEGGIPKVNQSDVWGMTKAGSDIWFGTAANTLCTTIGGELHLTMPFRTDSWVCEFGASAYAGPLPPAYGDWRPPHIFSYNTVTGALSDKSPTVHRMWFTGAIHMAATLNNVVLLGGPNMLGGINLFAYAADTGNLIGATAVSGYTDIQKALVVNNILYIGVGTSGGGDVLRWTGDTSNPFSFDVVGNVGGHIVDMAFSEDHIFASTLPLGGELAGLYMSPEVAPAGLTGADAAGWAKVWQADAYEPDPVVAGTYRGGALGVFQGYLYWGTAHIPFQSGEAFLDAYGMPPDAKDAAAALLGTYRATALFRGRNFATTPQIDLLYGNVQLPAYTPGTGWQIVPNQMGATPLFGYSGYNNIFNTATSSMAVFGGQLFIGTTDTSFLFASLLEQVLDLYDVKDAQALATQIHVQIQFFGADMFRFTDTAHYALPVATAGVGNYTSAGVRTMLSDDFLYLGMSNSMNLLAEPADPRPEGGWELIGLKTVPAPPVYGWVFIDTNGNGFRDVNEQQGLVGVVLSLEQGSNPGDATISYNFGWYQFDFVMPGKYTITAAIPSDYIATSPTSVNFTKAHIQPSVINFGVQKKWARIGDRVWYDANANGTLDAGEPGIGNVTVALLTDNAGAPGGVLTTTTTAGDGTYLFDGILPGTYWVKVTDQHAALARMTLTAGPNSQPSPDGPITVANKQSYLDADFGYAFIPGSGQTVIADTIWNDLNGDGVQDPGEPGIGGVRVCAQIIGTMTMVQSLCATSNANGIYGILAPAPRTYLVAVTVPPVGKTLTHGFYLPLAVLPGQRYMDTDFGYR